MTDTSEIFLKFLLNIPRFLLLSISGFTSRKAVSKLPELSITALNLGVFKSEKSGNLFYERNHLGIL